MKDYNYLAKIEDYVKSKVLPEAHHYLEGRIMYWEGSQKLEEIRPLVEAGKKYSISVSFNTDILVSSFGRFGMKIEFCDDSCFVSAHTPNSYNTFTIVVEKEDITEHLDFLVEIYNHAFAAFLHLEHARIKVGLIANQEIIKHYPVQKTPK